MCFYVWLYVAMCDNFLPSAAIYDDVLLCVTMSFNVLCMTMCFYVWLYVAMCDDFLPSAAIYDDV
jgi:hypothetical protein